MSILISCSPQDKPFVGELVIQLAYRNVDLCMLLYDFSESDELIEEIISSNDGSSILLVIISKASVDSMNGNEMLPANLQLELERKRVVVVPVILDECEVPEFARLGPIADFRTDCDSGLYSVMEGLRRLANTQKSSRAMGYVG